MKKSKFLFLFLIYLISFEVNAQHVIDHYSGQGITNIPLYTLDGHHVSLPVALSNVSAGFRPNQLASDVGFGWGLSTGASISREVKGLPDDYRFCNVISGPRGYLYGGGEFKDLILDNGGAENVPDYNHIENAMFRHKNDVEPDIYHFSAGGFSGSFVFSSDGNGNDQKATAIFLSASDVKIDYTLNDDLDYGNGISGSLSAVMGNPCEGGIEEFIISTPDGNKYIFNKRKVVYSKVLSNDLGQYPIYNPDFDGDTAPPSVDIFDISNFDISLDHNGTGFDNCGSEYQTRYGGVPIGDSGLENPPLDDPSDESISPYSDLISDATGGRETAVITDWYLTSVKNSLNFTEFDITYQPSYYRDHSNIFMNADLSSAGRFLENNCDFQEYSDEPIGEINFSNCLFNYAITYFGPELALITGETPCLENNQNRNPNPKFIATSINTTVLDWRPIEIRYHRKNMHVVATQYKNKLKFVYDDNIREDLYYKPEDSHDIIKARALSRIENYQNGHLKNQYHLNQSYFENDEICDPINGIDAPEWAVNHTKRLRLDGVSLEGIGESNTLDYNFEYYEAGGDLSYPPRHTLSQDLWGFYNASVFNGNGLEWFPTLYVNTGGYNGGLTGQGTMYSPFNINDTHDFVFEYGDKTSNEDATKLCMLKSIENPYGGSTEIDYELNDFLFEGNLIEGAGLRVSSTQISDNNGNNSTKSYNYTTSLGSDIGSISSGKLLRFPQFATSQQTTNYPNFGLTGTCVDTNNPSENASVNIPNVETLFKLTTMLNSFNASNSDSGDIVGYSSVTESSPNDGSVQYDFDLTFYADANINDIQNPETVALVNEMFLAPEDLEDYYDLENKNWGSFASLPNTAWYNRSLLKQTIRDKTGQLIQVTENSYVVNDFQHATGLRYYMTSDMIGQVISSCLSDIPIVNIIENLIENIFNPNSSCPEAAEPWLLDLKYRQLKYYIVSGDKRLQSRTTTYTGENNQELSSTTNFVYGDNHLMPIEISSIDSEGHNRTTQTTYPLEASSSSMPSLATINLMVERNQIYTPLEVLKLKNGTIIGGMKVDYGTFSTPNGSFDYEFPVPTKISSRGENDWITEKRFLVSHFNQLGFPTAIQKPGYGYTMLSYNFDGTLDHKNDNCSSTAFYGPGAYLTSYTYNEFGGLESITDPNNQTVTYEYDNFLRKDNVKTKLGAVESSSIYNLGTGGDNTVLHSVDFGDDLANSTETRQLKQYFDGFGRNISSVALGHSTSNGDVAISSTVYDELGRVSVSTNYQTGGLAYTYDGSPLSRIKEVDPAGPRSIKYGHKVNTSSINGYSAGELMILEVEDENEHTSTTYKDKLGRTILSTDALNNSTVYEYDAYDRLSRVSSPAGNFVITYDERHNVVSKEVPGAGQTLYKYNTRDEVVLVQDAYLREQQSGEWIGIEYDDIGRPLQTGFVNAGASPDNFSIATPLSFYTYDQGTGGASIGKATTAGTYVINPAGEIESELLETSISHDQYGRVSSTVSDNFFGGQDIVNYQIVDNADKAHQIRRVHSSSNLEQDMLLINSFAYDHAGRRVEDNYSHQFINDFGSGPSTSTTTTFGYDSRDFLTRKGLDKQGENVLQDISYGYNSRGWLTNINNINEYAEVQNKIPSCDEIDWNSCIVETIPPDHEDPKEPYCGECGDKEISLDELLSIRLDESDIALNCYQSCDCDGGKDHIDPSTGTCVKVIPECSDFDLLSQMESVELMKAQMAFGAISYPTSIYRVRLCNSSEVYVPQYYLPSIEGKYAVIQNFVVENNQQSLKFSPDNSSSSLDLEASLLSNYLFITNVNLEDYEACNQIDRLGTAKSETPIGETSICTLTGQANAIKVTGSSIFSTSLGIKTGDLMEVSDGTPSNSLTLDGNSWTISSSEWETEVTKGTESRSFYEAKWIIPYDFGETKAENVQITDYEVSIISPSYDLSQGRIILGLFDGKKFLKINGGQEYIRIENSSEEINNATIKLTPDVLPSGVQVQNMQVAMMVQAPLYKVFNLDAIFADVEYDTPCNEEDCIFEDQLIANELGESSIFGSYFKQQTGDLTTKFSGGTNSLSENNQYWTIGSMGYERSNINQEAAWDISYSQNRWEDAEVLEYSVDIDFPKSSITEHLYLGLFDGEKFIKINGGKDYLDIFGAKGSPRIIGYQKLTPDRVPTASQVAKMKVVIMVSKYFGELAAINVVKGNIKYKIPQCGEDQCTMLPSCTNNELQTQSESLAYIQQLMANMTVENLPVPNELHRVRLCDGKEINLFQHELDLLQGNYSILTTYAVPDDKTTFLIGSKSAEKTVSDTYIDLFSQEIDYYNPHDGLGGVAQFNGNISSTRWQVAGQSIKGYGYTYDAIDRLKTANFSEFFYDHKDGVCNNSTNGRYSVGGDDNGGIRYDGAGNIGNISRNGVIGECDKGFEFGKIDDITISRNHINQITSVEDTENLAHGFKTRNTSSNAGYIYNDSGSLTYDPNKGISILYNHLNLPRKIIKDDGTGSINFWYDTQGNLLKREEAPGTELGNAATIKEYAGNIEYRDGEVESIYHENGRFAFDKDDTVPMGYAIQKEFVLRDHLGNTRISFVDLDEDGLVEVGYVEGEYTEVSQENHYYPFGMKMEGNYSPTVGSENRYQYNGTEFLDDLEVNLTFYRTLDPALGSWWQVDPLASSFANWSPYNSNFDNPVRFVDPMGDSPSAATSALVGAAVGAVVGILIASATANSEGTATEVKSGLIIFVSAAAGAAIGYGIGGGIVNFGAVAKEVIPEVVNTGTNNLAGFALSHMAKDLLNRLQQPLAERFVLTIEFTHYYSRYKLLSQRAFFPNGTTSITYTWDITDGYDPDNLNDPAVFGKPIIDGKLGIIGLDIEVEIGDSQSTRENPLDNNLEMREAPGGYKGLMWNRNQLTVQLSVDLDSAIGVGLGPFGVDGAFRYTDEIGLQGYLISNNGSLFPQARGMETFFFNSTSSNTLSGWLTTKKYFFTRYYKYKITGRFE